MLDLDHNFLFANPAAERIFEVPQNGLIGKKIDDFLDVALNNESKHFESRIKIDNNLFKDILVTSTLQKDEKGNNIGTLEIFRDITLRKKNEIEIDENRQKLELINKILRHDLTNNLTVIKSAIRIFFRSKSESVLQEALLYIDKSVSLINKMREQEKVLTSKKGVYVPAISI